MDQLVRGSSASLIYRFLDGESPVALASVTFGAVDDQGTEVVANGTAAVLLADEPEGTAKATFTAAQLAEVGRLTVTWTGVDGDDNEVVRTQQVEVVGGFYFDLPELRALPDIADATEMYTTDRLERARRWAETRIEAVCGTSFVERLRTDAVPAESWRCRWYTSDEWPRRLLSVKFDETALTTDQLGSLQVVGGPLGYIAPTATASVWPWSSVWSQAHVRYAAGYSTEPPEDLRMAALAAARNRLLSIDGHSGIPDRARSISSGDTSYGLQMADAGDHPTGWFDIDAVITTWRNKVSTRAGIA